MLVPIVITIMILVIAAQGAYRYWQSPNPYRRVNALTTLCFLGAIALPVGLVTLARIDPEFDTSIARILILGPTVILLVLAFFFMNTFYDDIMDGARSPRARRHHRILGTTLIVTMVLTDVFWGRAIVGHEGIGPNWLLEHPLQEPDVLAFTWVCLIFLPLCMLRAINFNRRFLRITPLPWYKASNLCMMIFLAGNVVNNTLACVAILIPSATPAATWCLRLFVAIALIYTPIGTLAVSLSWNPNPRLQRFGERIWGLVTLWRLYYLWHVMTRQIPQVIPPLTMPWIVAVLRNHVLLLRDARIIEILDVVHRLNMTLWSNYSQQAWLPPLPQVIDHPETLVIPPSHQLQSIERLAMEDAQKLMGALAVYNPSQAPNIEAARMDIALMTLTRPPAFLPQEVHYLELVAFYFHRLHRRAAHPKMRAMPAFGEIHNI